MRRGGRLRGMTEALRVQDGGRGQPVLVLLHGMGATSDVWAAWRPVLARDWPGRWIAPDLPGHGGSRPLAAYSFGSLAAGVAGVLDTGDRLVLLGHSLGGVLGLILAGDRFDLAVHAVVGLGIKVSWTTEELARARTLAQREVSWFDSRREAADRYLRVSGLAGLLSPEAEAVDAGLREVDGRWRLAMDPAAFGIGAPDMPQLLAASRATTVLARGEHDQMVTDDQLRRLGMAPRTLAGLGHNAHVEDPAAVLRLVKPYATTVASAPPSTTSREVDVPPGDWRQPLGGV